ncbi:HD-GYP domain-containing protein [Paludibacterium yongneupense]|uniref:HD-GYP domain-containing protein n=1 Tax=Paludibacterium yongneupense TaxID=400061 RepID=UPI000686A809|nr:HD domain-containing phosphohydrolase [Paludibacterium yongneupense]
MSLRKKLHASQIAIGRPLEFDCFDSQGRLLLKKGLVIESERALGLMIEHGLFSHPEPAAAAGVQAEDEDAQPSPFQLLTDLNLRLKQILSRIGTGEPAWNDGDGCDFAARVMGIASSLQKVCALDVDAAIGLLHLDRNDRYTTQHPLHRSIVCELVGKRSGMSEHERMRVICASLTCDISMLGLQEELTRQHGPLTASQKEEIEVHPIKSAAMLRAFNVTDDAWCDAVEHHHEALDGSGYPRKVSRTGLAPWPRLIALADIYTAMITPRAYRTAISSRVAMRELFLKRGSHVDEGFATLIVKELGLYPPGAFVKLANGEIAIVLHRGEDSQTPVVKSVLGPRGMPLVKHRVRDTVQKEFSIQDVAERDNIIQINMNQLWGYPTGSGREGDD